MFIKVLENFRFNKIRIRCKIWV